MTLRYLMDENVNGRHIPGIFILNPKMSIGETIEELILIALASEDYEYRDYITHLPLN
ncbi:MAG: hypothetical protein SVX43_05915 [Cyanobacteriota bacterium]|nr:hypothetical protein [Cyanobacteriota bacterium]